jgi:MerR family copper efflux transcriptional regulator
MSTVVPIPRLDSGHLRIGDLARRAGKSARALRLYEDMGLLGKAVRSEGGQRLYDDEALIRLSWIDKLQLLGFSLHEIRDFLDDLHAAKVGPDAMAKVRSIFAAKLDEVRAQVRALESLAGELADGLKYLETCSTCEPSTLLGSCKVCDHQHPIEPPSLITGIHKSGEGR